MCARAHSKKPPDSRVTGDEQHAEQEDHDVESRSRRTLSRIGSPPIVDHRDGTEQRRGGPGSAAAAGPGGRQIRR
jgi:hypothetical protein